MNHDGWQNVYDYAADLRISTVAVWRPYVTDPPDGPPIDWAGLAPVTWAPIDAPTTTKDGS